MLPFMPLRFTNLQTLQDPASVVEVCKSLARLRRIEREPPKPLGSTGISTMSLSVASMGSSGKYCLIRGVRKSGSLAGGLLRTLEPQVKGWSLVWLAALGLVASGSSAANL